MPQLHSTFSVWLAGYRQNRESSYILIGWIRGPSYLRQTRQQWEGSLTPARNKPAA
jgi:hypothetical protein